MADDGVMVLGVSTLETDLAGPNAASKRIVMKFNPETNHYDWEKVLPDAEGPTNVRFAKNNTRVLVNWVHTGSRRRALYESDSELSDHKSGDKMINANESDKTGDMGDLASLSDSLTVGSFDESSSGKSEK